MFDKIKDFVSDITGGKDMGELDLGGAEKYLEGITYPVSKEELKAALKDKGVPEQVLAYVDKLPDQIFDSQDDLVKSLGAVAGAGGLAGLADKAGEMLDSTKSDAEGKLDSAKADVEGKLDSAKSDVDSAKADVEGKLDSAKSDVEGHVDSAKSDVTKAADDLKKSI